MSEKDWIPVSERLPEELQEVLVYLDKPYSRWRRIAFSSVYKAAWTGINGSVWPKMPTPTHWMPLPPKPKTTLQGVTEE